MIEGQLELMLLCHVNLEDGLRAINCYEELMRASGYGAPCRMASRPGVTALVIKALALQGKIRVGR